MVITAPSMLNLAILRRQKSRCRPFLQIISAFELEFCLLSTRLPGYFHRLPQAGGDLRSAGLAPEISDHVLSLRHIQLSHHAVKSSKTGP